jgi:hypothetical protein
VEYHTPRVILRALAARLLGRSDVARWRDPEAFDDWSDRTRLIAALVPAGSHVLEFGAGRRQLEAFLPAGTKYTPSDLVDRGPGTIVIDLNRRPFPDLAELGADTAVFAGVLEYARDLRGLSAWLSATVDNVIASYGVARTSAGTVRRPVEDWHRLGSGWLNTYTESELVDVFSRAGFSLKQTRTWNTNEGGELIFHFVGTRQMDDQ